MLSNDREALNLELQTFATSCRGATPLHLAAWSVDSVETLAFLLTHTDDDTLSSVLITVSWWRRGRGACEVARRESVAHNHAFNAFSPHSPAANLDGR